MELPVKQFQTRAEQAFVDLFNAAEQGLPGAGNPWVADLRAKAIDAYGALGLPHRRVEAWKYTDLRSRLTEALPLARATGVAVTEAELEKALGAEIAGLLGLPAGHRGRRAQGRAVRPRRTESSRRRSDLHHRGVAKAAALAEGRARQDQCPRPRSGRGLEPRIDERRRRLAPRQGRHPRQAGPPHPHRWRRACQRGHAQRRPRRGGRLARSPGKLRKPRRPRAAAKRGDRDRGRRPGRRQPHQAPARRGGSLPPRHLAA